uniref:Uncharacterized protein n=1 Tax=Meloidogyne enterolobii TaxID=390850 RepID=A0A6V7X726_MELEN|nr:unnamed protein product [Meloidogyne enterolobii]CAD2196967.1 unnamed protein product [Meloidogyne enterolobii]
MLLIFFIQFKMLLDISSPSPSPSSETILLAAKVVGANAAKIGIEIKIREDLIFG